MPEPKGKLGKLSTSILLGGQAADGISTQFGLNKNMYESNPFMPSDKVMNGIVKSATTAGELYALNKLSKNHPKLAKGLAIGVGASGIIPSLINIYRMNHK